MRGRRGRETGHGGGPERRSASGGLRRNCGGVRGNQTLTQAYIVRVICQAEMGGLGSEMGSIY